MRPINARHKSKNFGADRWLCGRWDFPLACERDGGNVDLLPGFVAHDGLKGTVLTIRQGTVGHGPDDSMGFRLAFLGQSKSASGSPGAKSPASSVSIV